MSGGHCPNGLVKWPRRCNMDMLGCCRVPLGCCWGPGGVTVEESGEGREWRGSGGQGCHHLLPGRRRGDGSGSQFRWETTGLPPTEDRRNSLLPPSKTQTSTSINFFIVTSHFEPSSTCIQPPLIENSFVVCTNDIFDDFCTHDKLKVKEVPLPAIIIGK